MERVAVLPAALLAASQFSATGTVLKTTLISTDIVGTCRITPVQPGWIDVATPYRTDQHQPSTRVHRPRVLAQLPTVGVASAPPPVEPETQLPPAMAGPAQLPRSGRMYFADQPPAAIPQSNRREGLANRREGLPDRRESEFLRRARQRVNYQHTSPARSPEVAVAPVSPLIILHHVLAPYAGLIVALALMACGSLLYWLLVGPVEVSLQPYAQGFPSLGQQQNVAAVPLATGPQFPVPPQTTPSEPTRLAQVSAGQSGFPHTSQSAPLDFSRLGQPPHPEAPLAPRRLPRVASRPAARAGPLLR